MEIAKPPDIIGITDRMGSLFDDINLISSDLTALCVLVEDLELSLFGDIKGVGVWTSFRMMINWLNLGSYGPGSEDTKNC
ncbi:hypothetical protein LINGRAPRIM_LOCUS2977 [Linum grandiflorum]